MQSSTWDAVRQLADAGEIIKSLIKARKSPHGVVSKEEPHLGLFDTAFDENRQPAKLLGDITPE